MPSSHLSPEVLLWYYKTYNLIHSTPSRGVFPAKCFPSFSDLTALMIMLSSCFSLRCFLSSFLSYTVYVRKKLHGIFAFFSSKLVKWTFVSVEFSFCSLFLFSNKKLSTLIFLYTHWPLIFASVHQQSFPAFHSLTHVRFCTSLDKSSVLLSHLMVLLSAKEITVRRLHYFSH